VEIDREKYRDKSIFHKRKVENNIIDYGLQSIVPALGLEMDSEKVIDYRDKSIFDKREADNNAIDYRLPINSSNPE